MSSGVYKLKVTIVGKFATGKTCLLERYTNNHFIGEYKTTIGADYTFKKIVFEDKVLELDFWDLQGQLITKNEITSNFFRDSSGIMICFNLFDQTSITSVQGWRDRSLEILSEDIPCVLVGTKADLGKMPEQNYMLIRENNHFHDWFQTSAKTGEGVTEAFEGLFRLMIEQYDTKRQAMSNQSTKIQLGQPRRQTPQPKASCLC